MGWLRIGLWLLCSPSLGYLTWLHVNEWRLEYQRWISHSRVWRLQTPTYSWSHHTMSPSPGPLHIASLSRKEVQNPTGQQRMLPRLSKNYTLKWQHNITLTTVYWLRQIAEQFRVNVGGGRTRAPELQAWMYLFYYLVMLCNKLICSDELKRERINAQ